MIKISEDFGKERLRKEEDKMVVRGGRTYNRRLISLRSLEGTEVIVKDSSFGDILLTGVLNYKDNDKTRMSRDLAGYYVAGVHIPTLSIKRVFADERTIGINPEYLRRVPN